MTELKIEEIRLNFFLKTYFVINTRTTLGPKAQNFDQRC